MNITTLLISSSITGVTIFYSCNSVDHKKSDEAAKTIFRLIDEDKSGIQFLNKLTESNDVNYFFYPDLYGGGGVAVGDINNDGLPDVYSGQSSYSIPK